MTSDPGFELSGVAHLIQPWGDPASDLEQLRLGIASAPAEVLFRHAVQYQLRHPGAEELPPDDFSAWIGGVVQDAETAERLSFVVQGNCASTESLRAALLEVLNTIPEKRRVDRDAPTGSAFLFLSAHSLCFPTGVVVDDPQELVDALLAADASVWFYHLIEEPWRGNGKSPVLDWIAGTGHRRLAVWLGEAAASGLPIDKARGRLLRRWRRSRIAKQVADVTRLSDDLRRQAGREVVAGLLRRRPESGEAQ